MKKSIIKLRLSQYFFKKNQTRWIDKSTTIYQLDRPSQISIANIFRISSLIKTRGQGLEPRLPGPKPGVLPLDDPRMLLINIILLLLLIIVNHYQ